MAIRYDFEEATALLAAGRTQQEIAERFGYASHSGFNRRYNRDLKSRKEAVRVQLPRKENRPLPLDGYASPPPQLNHDQFFRKYCNIEALDDNEIWEADYLTEMRNVLWDSTSIMVQEPRGYGKSFSTTALVVEWMLTISTPVLVVTSNPNKDKWFDHVYYILNSEEIKADWGEVIQAKDQNKGVIVLDTTRFGKHRDPHFQVVGRDSDIIGGHGGLIILEDVIQEEYVSPQSNERLRRWYKRTVRKMRKRNTKLWVIGTRKEVDDFYNFVEKEMRVPVLKKQAIKLLSGRYPLLSEIVWDKDQPDCAIDFDRSVGTYEVLPCPEWPIERLMGEHVLDPDGFEAEMNNNPYSASGSYFELEHWQELNYKANYPQAWEFYMAIDPAIGQGVGSDNTGIMVVGIYDHRMYLVDGLIDKLKENELVDSIEYFKSRYKVSEIVVENVMWNQLIFERVSQEVNASFIPFKDTRSDAKYLRINFMKRYFRTGAIRIQVDCPIKDKLKVEYLSYDGTPSTASRHDDGLDALSMLLRQYGEQLEFRHLDAPEVADEVDYSFTLLGQ